MIARIILGGFFQGNPETWENVRAIGSHFGEFRVYVGCPDPSAWSRFPLPFEGVRTAIPDISATMLADNPHPDRERYNGQWQNLYQAYRHFCPTFDDGDVVIKGRNDLVFAGPIGLDPWLVTEGIVYTPAIECHETVPFDVTRVINDQLILGLNRTMSLLFKFPEVYRVRPPRVMSIEEMVRDHLREQSVAIQTFSLRYGLPGIPPGRNPKNNPADAMFHRTDR